MTRAARWLGWAWMVLSAGAAWAAPKFAWPDPGRVASQVEVPGELKALGVPTQLRAYRVKRKVAEVVDFYRAAFHRGGLYLAPAPRAPELARQPVLTGLDTVRMVAYSVVLQANSDGSTTVVLGESNLGSRAAPESSADFAPLFPGAEAVLRSEQEGAQALTYTAKATPEELASFYREILGKAGFIEEDPALAPGVFQRRGEQVRVLTRVQPEGRCAVAVMYQSLRQ